MKRIIFIPLLAVFLLISVSEAQAELRLKAIMAALENDMELIVRAINSGDLKSVEGFATEIADHEKPPLEERQRIMGFLKEDAQGFKAADMVVHNAATELADAAVQNDYERVLSSYTNILTGCVKCHSRYRARVMEHFYGGK